jgi:hypothetical protein
MRSRVSNWVRLGVFAAVVAGTQTGCKSGWKMPGADMFSFTRKPSESTLSGGPTVSMTPTTQSPALKSTPSPIQSTALGGTRPSPYGASPAGATAGVPGAGAAATANGYTTGNYATNPTRPTPGANPYGAPVGPTSQPGFGTASSMANAGAPAYGAPAYGAPAYGAPSAAPGYGPGLPPPSHPAGAHSAMPMAGSIPPAGGGYVAQATVPPTSYGVPGYVPAGNSVNATPAGYSSNVNLPPSMPPTSSMPIAYGGTQPPNTAPAGSQQFAAPSSYRPGSINRSTSYDFSNQGPGASGPMSPMPPSIPRTANELPGSVQR